MIILCNPSTMFGLQTRNELHNQRRKSAYAKKQKKRNLSKNRSKKRRPNKVPHKIKVNQTSLGMVKREKLRLVLKITHQLLMKKNSKAGITLCSFLYLNTLSKNTRSNRYKNSLRKKNQVHTMLRCLQMKMMRIQIPSLKRKKRPIK